MLKNINPETYNQKPDIICYEFKFEKDYIKFVKYILNSEYHIFAADNKNKTIITDAFSVGEAKRMIQVLNCEAFKTKITKTFRIQQTKIT